MDYQTVFDISEAGYKSWSFPAFGLIFVAIGIVLVATKDGIFGWKAKNPRKNKIFAYVYLGFAIIWTSITFMGTFSEYISLKSAHNKGQMCIVEGKVSNFIPMPYSGHAMEKFCVNEACFEYSDYVITGGFNNTSSHGGPIRANLPVRVTYVDNKIIKLEVAKQ